MSAWIEKTVRVVVRQERITHSREIHQASQRRVQRQEAVFVVLERFSSLLRVDLSCRIAEIECSLGVVVILRPRTDNVGV
jgi:hypothetical protein